MKSTLLPISRGMLTLIDQEDYQLVASVKWYGVLCDGRWYVRSARGVYLHRLLAGAQPGQWVDHANNDGLDNRRENLRLCTISQNNANRMPQPHSSKRKGVTWSKKCKKWQAQIRINGRQTYLGVFDSEDAAAAAYDIAAKRHYGDFARHNGVGA